VTVDREFINSLDFVVEPYTKFAIIYLGEINGAVKQEKNCSTSASTLSR
jgi:hypothetical protein